MYRMLLFLGLLLGGQLADAASSANRVAIIDKFYPPLEGFESAAQQLSDNWLYGVVDIDRDRAKEAYYHGDVVQLIAAHPSLSFIRYPMRNNGRPMAEIADNLRLLLARLPKAPVEALLLSWESSTLISALDESLHLDHVLDYQQRIREWGLENPSWHNTYLIIQLLEQLVDAGVKVYTIAGNGGPRMINTFSLARGVITVGALEAELKHFVADNPFVDVYEQAAYFIRRVDDDRGTALGYDLNGDDCADIPAWRLTGHLPNEQLPLSHWKPITGSSFAAPAALKRALVNADAQTCSSAADFAVKF